MGALLSVPMLIAGQMIYANVTEDVDEAEIETQKRLADRQAAVVGVVTATAPGRDNHRR